MLPKTIACTLTAVPHSAGMPYLRAVDLGAVVLPGVEDGVHRAVELLHRILGEILAAALLDELLELADDPAQVVLLEAGVVLDLRLRLRLVEDDLEGIVVLAGVGFDAHDDATIHLQEAAVAVPGELRVAGLLGERLDDRVVDAEVEDGVHHAGHRLAGAGADREEQRVLEVAELLAHHLLDLGDVRLDLGVERLRVGLLVVVVVGADLGGDRHAGRDRETDVRHLGEVGALAAEERFLGAVPVRLATTEEVDVLVLFCGRRLCAWPPSSLLLSWPLCGNVSRSRWVV